MLLFLTDPCTQSATFKIANEPENKPTNRFRDIVPYDDTRVKLKSGTA